MANFGPGNIKKPLRRTVSWEAWRWTIPVSEGSHLFVKWKEGLATTCSCPFQSGNAFVFSLQRWQGIIYVCGFAKRGHCNPGPLPGLDRKGLWSWSALTKPWFQRCDWYISPSFKTLGILGRSIKKCETLAVGVVVLEIPVLFLASTPALPELGPTFTLTLGGVTSGGVRCWPQRLCL